MRSLTSAANAWQEIKQFKSLQELKQAVRLGVHSSVASAGLRSVFWKAFLLFESVDTAQWAKTLLSSRSAYDSLRLHFLRLLENADELSPDDNPMGEDSTQVSSFIQYRGLSRRSNSR